MAKNSRRNWALWNLRRARNLGQKEIAAAIGISQQHYSHIEGGFVPPPELRTHIALVLGTSVPKLWRGRRAAVREVA